MLRSSYLGGLLLAIFLPAGGAAVGALGGGGPAPGRERPSLTVYTGNLALVRVEVERALARGAHTVRIDGLPANIDASSLVVLNEGVTLLGAHGLRSYQDVAAGPGASIDLDLELEREVERLQLAFLTTGLSWSASYSLIVAGDDASARVDGYATVVNNSGAGYTEAEVQLLAGTIRQGGGRFEADAAGALRAFQERAAQAPALRRAAFGDYHLYTVSTPLSIRSGESRRIRLMGAESVKTRKEYVFSQAVNYRRPYPEPVTQPVVTSYKIERKEGGGFGDIPLPAGQVRIFQRDDAGRIQLLGIAAIGNTPKRTDLRLTTGYAFDIIGTRTQTDYSRTSGNVYESAWKVVLTNGGAEDVTVQVIEQLSGDWRLIESSHASEKLSAGAVRFAVTVPADGEATLAYRVSVRN